VDALVLVDMAQEATSVAVGLVKIVIDVQRDLLFPDGTHETLAIAMLGRLTNGGHAEPRFDVLQCPEIGDPGVLHPWSE
jgi:hypothetical protein